MALSELLVHLEKLVLKASQELQESKVKWEIMERKVHLDQLVNLENKGQQVPKEVMVYQGLLDQKEDRDKREIQEFLDYLEHPEKMVCMVLEVLLVQKERRAKLVYKVNLELEDFLAQKVPKEMQVQ